MHFLDVKVMLNWLIVSFDLDLLFGVKNWNAILVEEEEIDSESKEVDH